MSHKTAILIYGYSGSGKTTAINFLREFTISKKITDKVMIPHRYTTRIRKEGENFCETTSLSFEEFNRLKSLNLIEVVWKRPLPSSNGDIQYQLYGFEKISDSDAVVYVMSGNNSLFKQIDILDKCFSKIIKIFIYSSLDLCNMRIADRSPNMEKNEKEFRLNKEDGLDGYDYIIENNSTINDFEKKLRNCFSIILSRLLNKDSLVVTNEDTKYIGKIAHVYTSEVEKSNGKNTFEYMERSPGVRILIYNQKCILMNREWRDELNHFDFRLPGGKVFDRINDYLDIKNNYGFINESILQQAAAKELKEETGMFISSDLLQPVYMSIAGSTVIWDLHYLEYKIKKNMKYSKQQISTLEGEITQPIWVAWQDVLNLCFSNRVMEDRTVSFLLKKAFHLNLIK